MEKKKRKNVPELDGLLLCILTHSTTEYSLYRKFDKAIG